MVQLRSTGSLSSILLRNPSVPILDLQLSLPIGLPVVVSQPRSLHQRRSISSGNVSASSYALKLHSLRSPVPRYMRYQKTLSPYGKPRKLGAGLLVENFLVLKLCTLRLHFSCFL